MAGVTRSIDAGYVSGIGNNPLSYNSTTIMSQALKRQRLDYEGEIGLEISVRKSALSNDLLDEELNRKVKDVVRYALACEYKKVFIRKDDINKKILQEHSRQFNVVFKAAKEQLMEIFGMTLVEVPVRDKMTRSRMMQSHQPNSSQVQSSQAKLPSSHSYILYNVLNKELGAHQILHKNDAEHSTVGLLYFILCMIFVNEQELGEGELKGYLDKVGVKDQSNAFGDLEKLLTLYVKQGYLHRIKETNEEESIYQWGPRSKIEISSKDLARFMASFYGSDASTDLEESILKSGGK